MSGLIPWLDVGQRAKRLTEDQATHVISDDKITEINAEFTNYTAT